MPKYTKSVEICKMKHRYPCNLFLELFPDFNDDKFATVYVDNITIILMYSDMRILVSRFRCHMKSISHSKESVEF